MLETVSVPIRFIDSIKEKQHIALFYEDAEYARLLEFRFIKNGLDNGEQCIYATEDDSGEIVLKLLRYGIPLDDFITKRILVFHLESLTGDRDSMMSSCKCKINEIMSGLDGPFRIVSRIVPDVSTLLGMDVEMELEELTHQNFDAFGGSLICPYDISKIESTRKSQWLARLRSAHHAVIYAPRFGEGGVIYTPN